MWCHSPYEIRDDSKHSKDAKSSQSDIPKNQWPSKVKGFAIFHDPLASEHHEYIEHADVDRPLPMTGHP